jgi:hypothetical protein
MAETVSISVTGDISGLQTAMEAAAQSVNEAADRFVDEFQRSGNATEQLAGTARQTIPLLAQVAGAGGGAAARMAGEILQTNEKLSLELLQAEEQKDKSLFQLGQETAAELEAQDIDLANRRLKVEQDYWAGRYAQDAEYPAEHQKDLDQIALAEQQSLNRIAQIHEQAAQRQRESDERGFADFERAQQNQVKAVEDANAEKFKAGQIGVQQQEQQDLQALESAATAVHAQFDALTDGWNTSSEAYRTELDKRLAFDEWYAEQKKHIEDQADNAEVQAWQNAERQITSSEDTLINDIFTKRQSLNADLLQLAGQLVEKEIESDVTMWTEKALQAVLGSERIKVTEQGGALWNLLFNQQDVAQTTTTEAAKTGAVTAGVTSRTAIEKSGAAMGLATQATTGSSAIMNDAYQAAAATYAAVAQIPVIGPFLAPEAAGVAFGAVMSFDSLVGMDVGAWELPSDMPAMLHKGEMVVPQNFAEGLRSNGRSGDIHSQINYSPTINMREPQNWKALLQGHSADIVDEINRGFRTGMPARPSGLR